MALPGPSELANKGPDMCDRSWRPFMKWTDSKVIDKLGNQKERNTKHKVEGYTLL